MTNRAVSVAGLQTLGAPCRSTSRAKPTRSATTSVWVAEANAAEAMALLGAISQAAPHVGLGTGVLALQLRTPPLHAMAAATLQQLAGDRDVFLGVGISSPAVAGQWHGAGYTDRPIAQVREFVTLLRECLSGETVTFDGDFYTVKRFRLGVRLGERSPKIVARRAQRADAAPRRRDRRRRAAQLPAGVARAVVRRAGARGRRRRDLRVRALRRDRPRPLRRPRPQGPPQLRGRRRVREPVRTRPASPTTSPSSATRWKANATATARSPRSATRGSTTIQIMGDADHVRGAVQEYADNGVDVPIVFALPWGEDRRATVSETLRALGADDLAPGELRLAGAVLEERLRRRSRRPRCRTPRRTRRLRGRGRRRAAVRARRRSTRFARPIATTAPVPSSAAQCSASCSTSSGAARPGRRGRSRAPRRRAPAARSRPAPWRAPGRRAGPAAACRPRRE